MRTLVLWDIDHTLINAGGVSAEIYAAVFTRLIGRPPDLVAPMAGRTDLAITADTLRHHGVDPTPRIMESFTGALADAFTARQAEITTRGRVLPGARALLEVLADRPDVVQSVLTGNMRPIAECKLAALDLATLVDFDAGAYGLDGTERPPLVKLAQQRAAHKYGEEFDAAATVLIGDTPHDVRAGHEGGARVVAVATGATSAADLRLSGAEVVLPDLTDTRAALQALLPHT
ncbi:haloacid dehalogenase-like hydrolase [Actinomadura graeca]|uniref:Haloacid dehalogenase-like hydrolase n=1 Tax=Actinomadura graeca TaxID=2750812 RepID=A0ABX8QVB1_9ACTN|nr:haloacid dehalogenase-like hydrolase [Actinomadura graeca]QXJ22761.1 haloacid dehalogenase-like hydrolase [Actinomadura graeca]